MPIPNSKYVIAGFGLNGKSKVFSGQIGESPGPNLPDYPQQETTVVNQMNSAGDDTQLVSYLGTPVFADLILKTGDADEGLQLLTVLIEVSQSKNIVTTAVQGLSGTVKEYISDGDYQLNIKGALVNQFSEYPLDDAQKLVELFQFQNALQCVSPFLQLFGIYNLVVTDYRLPQQEGFQNVQLFECNAISDKPIELIEETIL